MPNYWIVKTEPSTYSFDDLTRQKTAVWDGVKNNLALKHLRQMKPGDRVLVYHTGDEKAVVGVGELASGGSPAPRRTGAGLGAAAVCRRRSRARPRGWRRWACDRGRRRMVGAACGQQRG